MKRDLKYIQQKLTEKEIINKLFRYCAYQERAISDINKQLEKYQISYESRKVIVQKLIDEGFLNEIRFAKTYTHGKFRGNNWGKLKIAHGLKEKSIDVNTIQSVIDTIDNDEYIKTIDDLIIKKERSLREKDIYIKKNKIARYIIYKGFESTLVWEEINKILDK